MKAILKYALLMIVALLSITACNTNPMLSEPETINDVISIKSVNGFQPSSSPIWAGQNINA